MFKIKDKKYIKLCGRCLKLNKCSKTYEGAEPKKCNSFKINPNILNEIELDELSEGSRCDKMYEISDIGMDYIVYKNYKIKLDVLTFGIIYQVTDISNKVIKICYDLKESFSYIDEQSELI